MPCECTRILLPACSYGNFIRDPRNIRVAADLQQQECQWGANLSLELRDGGGEDGATGQSAPREEATPKRNTTDRLITEQRILHYSGL